jgi:hypothetical protein
MSSNMLVSMTQDQLKALVADALRDALAGKLDLSAVVSSASSSAPAKAKRAKKEKDPDAPKKEPNDWIKFTSRVRSVLAPLAAEGKKLHPKAVTQTASALKAADLMGSASDDQIRAAYAEWLAHPPEVSKMVQNGQDAASRKARKEGSDASSTASSAKSAKQEDEASAEDAAPKKKGGRKPMTPEQKAEAKAKRDAKKAAEKAGGGGAAVVSPPPKASAVVAEDNGSEDVMDFEPFTWKKMSLLRNARGDVLTEDMEWFGKWDEASNKVDTSAPQPTDLDL